MGHGRETRGDTLGTEGAPAERRQKALVWFVGILLAMMVAWTLRQTTLLTMPLVAAFFIALAIWPVVSAAQRVLPAPLHWLGHVAAMAIVVLLLALFFGGIWFSASQLGSRWGDYDEQFATWWEELRGLFDALRGQDDSNFDANGSNPLAFVGDFALRVLRSVWQIVAVLVLVFFYVLLMLIEAPVWRDKLADGARDDRAAAWFELVRGVARRFRWYVLVRVALGLASGLLYYGWLAAWGIDFALLWGLLAFLLNFVPTLGSLLSGLLPALFAFVQVDLETAAIVAVGLLVIEQVMGNYIDPRLQGRQLTISPLVVLVMLLLWGWIWGVPGALLAVPITVLLVMVFTRIPALVPVALALSGARSRAELRERMGGG